VDAIVPAGGAAIYDYRVSCVSVIEGRRRGYVM
jgi:hypothetical protein